MVLVKMWPIPEEVRAEIEGKEIKKAQEEADRKEAAASKFAFIKPTQTDSPRSATESFQGKTVVIKPGDKIVATSDPSKISAADKEAEELVPTGTSYIPYFPKTIQVPTSTAPEEVPSSSEYQLLGLGIRKVSFLRVQVYVLGLYVKTSDLSILQNHLINTVNPAASALIPSEKEELRRALLDPERSEEIWDAILKKKGTEGVNMAIRVVPVRGTDFKHLQDGWMRGVASRTDEVRRRQQALIQQQAQEEKKISLPKPVDESEFADESFGLAMKDFKALFQGRGKAPKGSIITLTRNSEGVFAATYQPLKATKTGEKPGQVVPMGEVRDERVGRLVWLLYLGGKNVSSEDARKNIVEGCIGIVERPVGTVEGMIQ
jgi:hypothetical protein